MTSLQEFRKMKDDFFARDGSSPLTPEQKKAFKGLRYFPPNSALNLEVKVDEFPDKQHIEMQTTTGDIQVYERYGKFRFSVDDHRECRHGCLSVSLFGIICCTSNVTRKSGMSASRRLMIFADANSRYLASFLSTMT